MSGAPEETVECASPACAMPPFQADAETRREILAWRRQERARLIAERLAVPADSREIAARAIAGHLLAALPETLTGRTVSLYWPIKGEPDLRSLLEAVEARGGTAALPVATEVGKPLDFRRWRSGAAMTRGLWNIPMPAEDVPVVPDFLLAPLVGHDAAGYRLGYGGGFFDRTLGIRAVAPVVYGVGYDAAAIVTIRPLAHDIPMSAIVTESGCRRVPARA